MFGGAYRATSVENCGESPITTVPQRIIAGKKIPFGSVKSNGEHKHKMPDTSNCPNATLALPMLFDMIPPPMHPILPQAIMQNDQSDTSISLVPCADV